MEMEDLVQNPKRITKLADLNKGILAWDNMYKEFKEAGGEKLSAAREVNILAKCFQLKSNSMRCGNSANSNSNQLL